RATARGRGAAESHRIAGMRSHSDDAAGPGGVDIVARSGSCRHFRLTLEGRLAGSASIQRSQTARAMLCYIQWTTIQSQGVPAMPAQSHFAESPREVGLDPEKVEALFSRAEREIKEGLLPSTQIAIARNGKIGAMRTVGRAVQGGSEKPATNDTFYVIFSCTKAIMSAASWILMGEGKLSPSEVVADIIPEFGSNGKDKITVEEVLLHVGGFPNAPYPQDDWLDKSKRLDRFAMWRLEWPVGSKFEYHPTSGFWVIAEIIERRTGKDFRQFVHERISMPLGLPELRVGLPREYQQRVAQLCYVGEPLSDEERKKL